MTPDPAVEGGDLADWLRDWLLSECEHALTMDRRASRLCCAPCLRDRILTSPWLAALLAQAEAKGAAAVVERVEAVLADPDDTQWWPVTSYMDPPNEDEVVEVEVIDAVRIRAAVRAALAAGGDAR